MYILCCQYLQRAWRICGYMPKLESQAFKSSLAFKDTNTALYQSCLRVFFQPLLNVFSSGGFFLDVLGKRRWLIPSIAFFAQDSLEGDSLSGVTGAWNSAEPCRLCHTKHAEMNNPKCATSTSYRFQEEEKAYLEDVIDAISVK